MPATSSERSRIWATSAGASLVRHLLTAVAVLGALGTVLGLFLVQRIGVTYRDGLEVTADAAALASLSAANAESIAADLVGLVESTSTSLDEAGELLVTASTTASDLGDALGTNIADALTGTSSIADRLAGLVEAVERFIPGDRDSLAEDLRVLSDGLEPVPDQLRALGTQLDTSATQLTDAAATIDTIVDQLDDLTASVEEAGTRLAEVQALSVDVADRAQQALDRSRTDLWLLRLLIVAVGLGVVGAAVAARRAAVLLMPPADPGTGDEGEGDPGAGDPGAGGPGAGGGTRTHTPSGTGT